MSVCYINIYIHTGLKTSHLVAEDKYPVFRGKEETGVFSRVPQSKLLAVFINRISHSSYAQFLFSFMSSKLNIIHKSL